MAATINAVPALNHFIACNLLQVSMREVAAVLRAPQIRWVLSIAERPGWRHTPPSLQKPDPFGATGADYGGASPGCQSVRRIGRSPHGNRGPRPKRRKEARRRVVPGGPFEGAGAPLRPQVLEDQAGLEVADDLRVVGQAERRRTGVIGQHERNASADRDVRAVAVLGPEVELRAVVVVAGADVLVRGRPKAGRAERPVAARIEVQRPPEPSRRSSSGSGPRCRSAHGTRCCCGGSGS